MERHLAYVVIEGEPFLGRARQYRADVEAVTREWDRIAMSLGAIGVGGYFPRAVPRWLKFRPGVEKRKGWTKPDARGLSKPKRGHPDVEVMATLPACPDVCAVFGDSVPSSYSYVNTHCEGTRGIGPFPGYQVGWAGEALVGLIPHVGRAALAHLALYPTDAIMGRLDLWTIPDGLREISKAEAELIFAQQAVDEERRKAA